MTIIEYSLSHLLPNLHLKKFKIAKAKKNKFPFK